MLIAERKQELQNCERSLAEITRLLTTEWAERQLNPQHEDVSALYRIPQALLLQKIAHLRIDIGSLESQLPCQALLDRFGLEMHEHYRQKYPINHDTTLRAVEHGRWEWHYLLPIEANKLIVLEESPSPFAPAIRKGTARFEQFVKSGWAYGIYLAWAPEINTVFYWE